MGGCFGALLMVCGALIAGLGGLCTGFAMYNTNSVEPLSYGYIPILVGGILIIVGRAASGPASKE